MDRSKAIWYWLALLVVILGCGGGGGDAGNGTSSGGSQGLTLTADATTLTLNGSTTLHATVPANQQNKTVIFSKAAGDPGTLTQTGPGTAVYTAPNSSAVVHITATADFDHSVTKTIILVVSPVSINPPGATLKVGASTEFTATVKGTVNQNVTFAATGGTVVKLAANKIRYTAPNTPGTFTLTATSAADTSQKASVTITVTSGAGGTATVKGSVKDETGGGVSGVIIEFFNSAGSQVGQATTSATGAFSGTIPTTATRFNLLPGSIDGNHYVSFSYNLIRYDPLSAGCSAPLPALTSGATVTLPNTIALTTTASAPPPPPNGCTG